ncbi:MAG: hypothetical protein O4805_09100, partial [Trichodesmium sp. St16_bin2-tuft]|nr:hypothetical protein [Trichodesmium sp. St16_bin2-tuft]
LPLRKSCAKIISKSVGFGVLKETRFMGNRCRYSRAFHQDLRIASICSVFLIIISNIYTTISVFA